MLYSDTCSGNIVDDTCILESDCLRTFSSTVQRYMHILDQHNSVDSHIRNAEHLRIMNNNVEGIQIFS